MAYCLFDTAVGVCAIAWTPDGSVNFFQLPESSSRLTEERIAGQAAKVESSPTAVTRIVDRVQRHLRGELQDFRDVPVELRGVPPFSLRVLNATREILTGETTSYGALATRLGSPGAARAVGQALGKNPIPLIIPCHRILAAGGKSGGFSAAGGVTTKSRLLTIEGALATLF